MNHAPQSEVGESVGPHRRGGGAIAWAIGPAFGVLAAWFLVSSPHAAIPLVQQPPVERARFAPGARRSPMSEPPALIVGGFLHSCNDCHRLFNSPPVDHRTLMQHTDIMFDHGMNNRCFNCHDRKNRERLALHDGTLIGFDDIPRLCSQCHGTVFRDWQAGTHGKTMGSWDVNNPPPFVQHRLNCNDCHDPHAPAYKPIAPLPAPNTLRMGDQSPHPTSSETGHHERHVPLRRWSLPGGESEPEAHDAPHTPSATEPAGTPTSSTPPAPATHKEDHP